ncbi:hypothetical protein [Nonomuraea basaltis]|uniref:hypothetical protein n=1 Tax=Nonomuraea basaltis TaxID=2495887 RepID=UPI00110C701A|nr:hypothetical protein [Nonomuraea basaltis]TMR98118.1 hypothetical protein EJK15_14075 [Nonomuraea basaltis]
MRCGGGGGHAGVGTPPRRPAVELLGAALPGVPAEIPAIHFTEAQRLTSSDEPDLSPAPPWLAGRRRRLASVQGNGR